MVCLGNWIFNESENAVQCEKIVCNSKCLMTMVFNSKNVESLYFVHRIEWKKMKITTAHHNVCCVCTFVKAVYIHVYVLCGGALMTRCKNRMFCKWNSESDCWRKWVEQANDIWRMCNTWIVDEKMFIAEHFQVVQ